MAEEPGKPDTNSKPPRLPLRERFVWLWHPHFWLTFVVVVVLIIFFLLRHAK
ncbi:MAG: hypothetical protein KDN19_03615 [Verrucomicrobiae bacterium]|nr:hypothetical protein [Verrucomicrobiae bacterium]